MIIQKRFNLITLNVKVLFFIGALFGGIGLDAQTWPSGVHDPSSMIKEGDKYWVFATGDGIYSKFSTDMVTWSDGTTPFPKGEFPNWILNYAKTSTDAFSGFFWAPDIIYMNNQYYLYYSCSVWGTRNSCVGVVVSKTLNPDSTDYGWVDQGDIGIYSPDFSAGGMGWDVNAIDPSVMRGPDGKVWMVWGSFNIGGIMVSEVDTLTGKPMGTRTSIANSWTGGSNYGEGEGGSMFYHNGYYYLIYNKGGCCAGINSSYYMVIGRSENPSGPFVDKVGKNMKINGATSGGTILFKHNNALGLEDRYFGPGHFGIYREKGIDYISFHYYNPTGNYSSSVKGAPTLGLAMLEWDKDGWPTISLDFIENGIYSLTNVNSNKAMDIQNHTSSNLVNLWQYPIDTTLDTQKWLFTALGAGEYSIQNYADFNHIEASGQVLRTTSAYDANINQKFRVVKGVDEKVLIYPTTRDEVFEIPNAYTSDSQIKLWWNTNHACQRWTLTPYNKVVNFSVTTEDVDLDYNDTTFSNISITTNGLWSITFEDASWLEATPASGEEDAVVSIHASINPTGEVRTNKIFIRSHVGKVDTAYVSQAENSNPPSSSNQIAMDNIKVYPNPSSGKVFIKVEDIASVNVYNSLGQRMLSSEIDELNNEIDFSQFETGIYIFEINVRDIRVQRMIIKE